MFDLSDRHWKCAQMCKTCANCFCIEMLEDDGVHDAYFCMLGLSKEESDIITDEVNNDSFTGMFPEDYEYSEPFKKAMRFEGSNDIYDSKRYVDADDCCNLYKGRFNEEKENA